MSLAGPESTWGALALALRQHCTPEAGLHPSSSLCLLQVHCCPVPPGEQVGPKEARPLRDPWGCSSLCSVVPALQSSGGHLGEAAHPLPAPLTDPYLDRGPHIPGLCGPPGVVCRTLGVWTRVRGASWLSPWVLAGPGSNVTHTCSPFAYVFLSVYKARQ